MKALEREQRPLVALAILPVYFLWLVNGFYLRPLSSFGPVLFWCVDFMQWVVLPALLIIALRSGGVGPLHYFQGWKVPVAKAGGLLLQGVIAAVLIGFVYRYVHELVWRIAGYPEPYFSFLGQLPQGRWRWVFSIYSAVTAGVVESFFFIGLPWALCRETMKKRQKLFVIGFSVIFGLAHWEQGAPGVVAAFASNLCFCAWYFFSRSLWPVILAHSLIDLAIFA